MIKKCVASDLASKIAYYSLTTAPFVFAGMLLLSSFHP
jgi:hypothetical protein